MKSYFSFFVTLFLFITTLSAQQPTLFKLWETDTLLTTCESVLYDSKQKLLYVSNIEGVPAAKDGKGSISKVGLDGKIINRDWVTGLNAPKGLGLYKNTLWVNNIDELVAIDIKTGMIKQRVKIEGAKFLNDLTISKKGVVYTSDSDMKKVYQLKDGKLSTYLENFRRPNGVLAIGKDLYILDSGKLLKANSDKQLTTIAEGMLGSTDGIERVSASEFIVSSWGGAVYHVQTDGTVHQLLDTQTLKINLADIGYDAKKRIVYIPTFNKNTVVAYELR